ncbi:chemotaxis protein CheA [Clostridium tagluense]|uniref:chemotaxis protein CheA n=1 Tax=Clostridium tagluense TaxID=360422 RepID=UPI001CF4F191|nr:chemotaxis protein CheA [Clostridium tagluense]MCB2312610.1 chemotaxis protein CheA [Clostridium tagluense]MCB2317286.1 chemotaxis protein CheA [Clostridium tagluense]MCB2322153.1 chemotaxis protein CheA [Clostridium tagluense]MCB2327082.1 chemotaxis protein CheA [Clostridium tagluense]MCB2331800.1 chemotaxis protein CheA [Clostridium tagluense]
MSEGGMSREPMLEVYIFEATQLMEQLEEISIECEKSKNISKDAINEIFRIMHTIKSSSAMMMFNNISVLAHSLEDLFYFIRESKDVTINFEHLFDLVLSGIDFIKGEVSKIQNDCDADGSSESLVLKSSNLLRDMKEANGEIIKDYFTQQNEDAKYYISSYQSAGTEVAQKYVARIFYEDGCEMENVRAYTVIHNLKDIAYEIYHLPKDIIESNDSVEEIRKSGFLIGFSTYVEKKKIEDQLNEIIFLKELELIQVEEYPPELKSLNEKKEIILEDPIENIKSIETNKEDAAPLTISGKGQSIISVNISKLDMLLDLVGEIVITEAMVTKNPDLDGLQLDNFNKAARQLRKLTNELQDVVMSIRMVPVSMTFHKMNRIVRDMSKKLNKEVELEIIGEDTEVDKNIIDHISDPLMHLVRNSLDHGLEEKEERVASGKPEIGKITLEAKNAGGDVFIIVRDDGRGLDKKSIYEKAKLQGLVTKPEDELTDKEIFSNILLPGFSTNESVTEYSGRGVGMDVVKKNIDSIGGSISIESLKGKGSKISIKIPLTLAIIDGLEVAVGKSKYTIPITAIRESFKPKENEVIGDSEGNEMIMIRGEAYPIHRIHRIFNINTEVTSSNEGILVLVEDNTKAACLFVDSLIGEQQVVVKSLPPYIKKANGIAGCTILGDGNISLIIDISGILDR